MPTDEDIIKCALSGSAATDLIEDADDDDDMGEAPIGWLRITVERRGVNPEWVEFQTRKQRQLANAQAQTMAAIPADFPEAERAEVMKDIEFAINCALKPVEDDLDKYETYEEVVYVRDPGADKAVGAAWLDIAKNLGLTAAVGGAS